MQPYIYAHGAKRVKIIANSIKIIANSIKAKPGRHLANIYNSYAAKLASD